MCLLSICKKSYCLLLNWTLCQKRFEPNAAGFISVQSIQSHCVFSTEFRPIYGFKQKINKKWSSLFVFLMICCRHLKISQYGHNHRKWFVLFLQRENCRTKIQVFLILQFYLEVSELTLLHFCLYYFLAIHLSKNVQLYFFHYQCNFLYFLA